MYAPTFAFAAFNGERDWDLSARLMTLALDFWTEVDVEWLRAVPSLPPLYQSGVRYYADRYWEGPWLDAMTVALTRFADCKSLATYRCAELRVRHGIMARPEFDRQLLADGTQWFHVYVRLPDGRFEYPSRILGMK
jgi:hypothetical protein